MILRTTVMQHVPCMYWTILLTFCGTLQLVTGTVNSDNIRNNHNYDSVHLRKLRVIAGRLDDKSSQKYPHHLLQLDTKSDSAASKTREVIRAILSKSGNTHSQDSSRRRQNVESSLLQDSVQIEILKRYNRQATDAMQNFQSTFKDLYTDLSAFLTQLSSRLKPDASTVLQYAPLILELLQPDDPGFSSGDVATILNKFNILRESANGLLENVPKFVRDEFQASLTSQLKVLKWEIRKCTFATISFGVDGFSIPPSLLSGISGINTGVLESVSYETLSKLYQLLSFLVTGIAEMPT